MRVLILFFSCLIVMNCSTDSSKSQNVEVQKPDLIGVPFNIQHVVFVTGDEEYRSEESMPMLAKILEREMGAKVSVCFATDSAGYVNPNINDHIEGLEILQQADLMVLFMRWRALPKAEREYITDFAESGKPMIGFRTSTHAFKYEDPALEEYNNEWPTKVFGQQWITHHGHFDDGDAPLTAVSLHSKTPHPILKGVTPFDAYSWLYHVNGGEWELSGRCNILLDGHSLRSKQEQAGKLDQYPLDNPVAWTKTYSTANNKISRVFFTTLGHPYDFKLEPMRKLALNSIYWALGREEEIPKEGVNVAFANEYQPNNSGFGEKYKQGLKPADFMK